MHRILHVRRIHLLPLSRIGEWHLQNLTTSNSPLNKSTYNWISSSICQKSSFILYHLGDIGSDVTKRYVFVCTSTTSSVESVPLFLDSLLASTVPQIESRKSKMHLLFLGKSLMQLKWVHFKFHSSHLAFFTPSPPRVRQRLCYGGNRFIADRKVF